MDYVSLKVTDDHIFRELFMKIKEMAATEDSIPIIDFEGVFTSKDLGSSSWVKQLDSALSKVGFMFIKNHGIDSELIDRVNSVALEFFSKSLEVKRKYLYCHGGKDTHNNGYICLGQEKEKLTAPGDKHEAFYICSMEECNYPDEEVPEFRVVASELYREIVRVALKILELIGHAVKPDDPLYFMRQHTNVGAGCEQNYSTARIIHYPPLPPHFDFSQLKGEDSVLLRKHEHVDFGSLTLLLPDQVGGLQVKLAKGGWIDVPYLPNAIVVNLGAFIPRWTSDRYLATLHRVIIPKDEFTRSLRRQTLAVFVHPSVDTVIECIDGSNKYPPLKAGENTKARIKATMDTTYESE